MFGAWKRRRAGAVAALVALAGGMAATGAQAAPPPVYYVAMGDSLGAGTGASGANAYVNRIFAHEAARIPGLQLQNISCGGATTGSVLNGPGCGAGTQIAHAEDFLRAHPGQVAFLTIDIGGNDVAPCNGNSSCAASALTAVDANLRKILARLAAAYPGLRVFGMNYYDPFLASWITGPDGQAAAQQSAAQSDQFNEVLTDVYTAAGYRTADVGSAYATDDFALTGTYNAQTVPQNVANVCAWTHMCDSSDFHANDTGHGVIAAAFEPLIDSPAAAAPPTAVTASPGNGSATVRWTRAANIGVPATTGYVVTPYLGTKAMSSRAYGATTSVVVHGLTNARAYTFRVAAKNGVATGARSAPSRAVVAGAPLAPRAVRATSTKGGATIRWTAPASGNGAPVKAYVVTPYLGAVAQKAHAFASTATTEKITGLARARAYTFRVAARNARGTSAQSAASAAIKPK